jgi:hypothetical protein
MLNTKYFFITLYSLKLAVWDVLMLLSLVEIITILEESAISVMWGGEKAMRGRKRA